MGITKIDALHYSLVVYETGKVKLTVRFAPFDKHAPSEVKSFWDYYQDQHPPAAESATPSQGKVSTEARERSPPSSPKTPATRAVRKPSSQGKVSTEAREASPVRQKPSAKPAAKRSKRGVSPGAKRAATKPSRTRLTKADGDTPLRVRKTGKGWLGN